VARKGEQGRCVGRCQRSEVTPRSTAAITEKDSIMTVTISRLYDNYSDAQRAVTSLEAAGVPH
jgi:hypothetical protein